MMQNHICKALGIEQAWINEGLDTLRLVNLYREHGQNYEDSRVVEMLANQSTEGQPCIQLLNLLRQCDADWLKESKYLPCCCTRMLTLCYVQIKREAIGHRLVSLLHGDKY
jgi:hypothetical protein